MTDSTPTPTPAAGVAAFDFDGTIARGDSLLPFFVRSVGPKTVARALLINSVALGLIGIGYGNRDATKAKFIKDTITGHDENKLRSIGESFAQHLIKNRLFDAAVERINWHKSQGHRIILVSAALDIYLKPLAETLRFDDVLCTTIEFVDQKATGNLIGGNVRAQEKAKQLGALLGDKPTELWAYGNSSGDKEMLEMADYGFWVNRTGKIKTLQ